MAVCKHYLISGRVQGVGFRAFTKASADRLRVRGWVRNLADGRVEAVALGHEDQLRQLSESLQRGPSHAQVEVVQVTLTPQLQENFTGFELKKDGLQPCLEP